MRALITTIIGTIAPATAFAAANELSADNSGIFVWVFLGFCAMIVVAQVVPAILLASGMLKGIVAVVKNEKVAATSKS